jgi:hypothetical protein
VSGARPIRIEASDLDLDAIREEAWRLADQSYRFNGLARSDVLWLLQTIAELLAVIEGRDS